MKDIIVAFWDYTIERVPYDHHEKFEYSAKTREDILDVLIGLGVNIFLTKKDSSLMIYVSDRPFDVQRYA